MTVTARLPMAYWQQRPGGGRGHTPLRSRAPRHAAGRLDHLHHSASDRIRMILLQEVRARIQMHDPTVVQARGKTFRELR